MTYKEIKKYLFDDCVVRNDDFEYKTETEGEDLFCREVGTENWRYVFRIGAYEKEMEWELVGKK
ncbi:hypothetical protein G9F73_012680 [Clostridium estertheticum]|uniref:hypothetical protein n=1 Tax=Clostridium estertheticum TaxID=238834 RepID=UPI0013EEC3DF|nr:hypothetical protein [Clostridium estertheticum]MBZ9608664.1 hypothetical protein [Clostridium estertheticum]